METWTSRCGHCRYGLRLNSLIQVLKCDTDVSLSAAERHPALLWLPGPGPADLLGCDSCLCWRPHRHAGGLAHTAARPHGRRAPQLHSSGLLRQWEGIPAEAWSLRETRQQGVWAGSGDPPGQTPTTQQPDESWSLMMKRAFQCQNLLFIVWNKNIMCCIITTWSACLGNLITRGFVIGFFRYKSSCQEMLKVQALQCWHNISIFQILKHSPLWYELNYSHME